MISDEKLRDAARAYEKAVLEALPEPEDCPAAFSPAFERKMKKLIFRVDHPVLYWLRRVLPILLLAGLITAALLLHGQTASEPAAPPAPVLSAPSPVQESEPPQAVAYRPTWLPEGCELDRETLYDGEGMLFYTAADGTETTFLYATDSEPWSEDELAAGMAVLVGDCPGVLCLGQSKGALNDLFWTDEDSGASFWLSAPFSREDMLRVAESVEEYVP